MTLAAFPLSETCCSSETDSLVEGLKKQTPRQNGVSAVVQHQSHMTEAQRIALRHLGYTDATVEEFTGELNRPFEASKLRSGLFGEARDGRLCATG